MRYEKPEIKIEKFSLSEDIMSEGTSSGGFQPIIDENDPVVESIGEVISNVFGID